MLNRYWYGFWPQFPAALLDDEIQDAGGEVFLGLAVAVRPAFEPGQITADAVVQAFDRGDCSIGID